MRCRCLPTIFVGVVLALGSRADLRGHSAVESAPRPDQFWKERQELLNKRAAEAGENAQVIFLGDSITQGWEGAGKPVWERYYTKRNAVNLGIGGDRTQHVLWRLENGNLNGLKPKAAVLMIGTNNSNGEDNTVEQIAAGVTAIVQKLRAALPDTKVLLLAIFPRGENPNAQRGKVLQVNQIIRKLADGRSVFWHDFGHKFLTSDGRIPRDLMPDFLHLSEQAYQIWAESIETRLSSVIGDSRIQAASAGSGPAALLGSWTWTINGPDGQPISAPMQIETAAAGGVTARFARGDNRWLTSEGGEVEGNQFSWTVKRDRPDGSTLVYRMSGTVAGDQISGTATTTLDSSVTTVPWSAKRN